MSRIAAALAAGALALSAGAAPLAAVQSPDLASLLASPVPPVAERTGALELLEESMEAWREDEGRTAAEGADRALARLPALADWRPLVRAELLAPGGDTAAVREALDALEPEGEYRARWGWTFHVEAYEAAEDLEGARRIALEAARVADRADRASTARLVAGELALEAGDTASARQDLWAAIELGTSLASAGRAAQIIDRLGMDVADGFVLGEALLAAGSRERAHRWLGPLLERGEIPAARAGAVRLELGRGMIERRRYAEAREILEPLFSGEAVDEQLRAEALYWMGRGALDRGDVPEAEEHFLRLARVAPGSYEAELGISLLLERELETGFGPRARGFLEEILAVGARGSTATRHVVQLATTRYLAGDYEDAAGIFGRHLEATRGGSARQQAEYWTALSLERIGRDEEARTRLESVHRENALSFYGVLAGERIGAPVLPAGLPEGPPPVDGLELELANAVLRLRVHRFVPTAGSFAYELDRLTDHFLGLGDAAYDFAEALIAGGFPLQGAVVGREIHDREERWNLRLLRIVHPLPYREAIVRESRARGLDPFFVAGTIRQESMFDAAITSSAGAVGLMQLLPSTARDLARGMGLRYSDELLSDPEYNLRLGTEFLADLARRFDGRAEDALAAYNAGPSRITRWRRDPTYRDGDVFVEHIPFAETRDYVKTVRAYTRIYSALYGCGDFDPCLGLSYDEVVARSAVAGGSPRSSLGRE